MRQAAVWRDEKVAARRWGNTKKLCVGMLFNVLVGILSSMLWSMLFSRLFSMLLRMYYAAVKHTAIAPMMEGQLYVGDLLFLDTKLFCSLRCFVFQFAWLTHI